MDCHGNGSEEGGVSFDSVSLADLLDNKQRWQAVLDNVRAGIMPPSDSGYEPTVEEINQLGKWIKYDAFGIDPKHPNPGFVVPRRLNRVEYQNTIRDLMGVRFSAEVEFPPDDTGGGFDNNGEVLSVSTLLTEKYLDAAESIIAQAVPQSPLSKSDDRFPKRRKQYERFFFNGPAPDDAKARDQYAAEVLERFATRAFRRPVEKSKIDQLVEISRSVYTKEGTFEEGISRSMMAVLASPRFLFRVEPPGKLGDGDRYPSLDEFSLASRLSYFLWSSMPDDELFKLAKRGELKNDLENQIQRMIDDKKLADGLVRNFTGQWLRARDVMTVEINGKAILRKGRADGNRRTKFDFDGRIRREMRQETEMSFEYVVRENRSIRELVNSDYTFLNERLANHYGIEGVEGREFRLVKLESDSPRGGILTQGTFLSVTSNPTRTSPVKRGVFILDNILGTPPPAPPPDVPELEAAIEEFKGKKPKLAEMLAVHRANDLCSSCHNRMDPLGLAFENFIPMGNWRDKESDQTIDPSGQLITGEPFKNVNELKQVLMNDRRLDYYRCITKKMLTYAVGRGLNYNDTEAVDNIVERLVQDDGRALTLIQGIIESDAFQKQGKSVSTTPNPANSPETK